MIDYGGMGERELDARAGLLAGTVVISSATFSTRDHDQPYRITAISVRQWPAHRGLKPCRETVEHAYTVPDDVPHYSTDANAARELEVEIKRRGLQSEYFDVLWEITVPTLDGTMGQLWFQCVHASARDRAVAFCVAMERAGEGRG